MDVISPTRTVGVVGLAAFVLLFTGVNLQDVGGSVEPSFDAPASEVSQFLASRNPAVFPIASYATVLGLIAFLWFAAGLASVLRPALPDRDWMPGVVLASGAAVAATVLAGSWEIAIRFSDDAAAVAQFRAGGLEFANSWLGMGSLALATGLAVRRGRLAPAWLGWWAIVGGVGLIAVRSVWTTGWWFLPYAIFWVWVVTVCIRMLMGRRL